MPSSTHFTNTVEVQDLTTGALLSSAAFSPCNRGLALLHAARASQEQPRHSYRVVHVLHELPASPAPLKFWENPARS